MPRIQIEKSLIVGPESVDGLKLDVTPEGEAVLVIGKGGDVARMYCSAGLCLYTPASGLV